MKRRDRDRADHGPSIDRAGIAILMPSEENRALADHHQLRVTHFKATPVVKLHDKWLEWLSLLEVEDFLWIHGVT